jgi:hypothetical protein
MSFPSCGKFALAGRIKMWLDGLTAWKRQIVNGVLVYAGSGVIPMGDRIFAVPVGMTFADSSAFIN